MNRPRRLARELLVDDGLGQGLERVGVFGPCRLVGTVGIDEACEGGGARGEVVEGSPSEIRRQRDVWTFARPMGGEDPNWQLVATGE